jgi:hypothetical protein
VPATHAPSFSVASGARLIPVGELVDVVEPPSGFTILGAGKTAMDACSWLLGRGVDPDRIRWVRPRDAWLMNRASFQPLDLIGSTVESLAVTLEVLAAAEDLEDLYRRLEECGELLRLDASVQPSMFRGAIVSEAERDELQQIERVVREGHVRHLDTDRIVLERGELPSGSGEIHVDCTAYGLRAVPPRPIFERGRVTVQSLMGGFTTLNAALVGFVEAVRDDDEEKNRLCPPTPYPSDPIDWITVFANGFSVLGALSAEPDLGAWMGSARLGITRGLSERMDDPQVQAAMGRWFASLEQALDNAQKLQLSASG